MQTDLSLRMEKLWAMADIATRHGMAEYGRDGTTRTASLTGFSFHFDGDDLTRIRGKNFNVAIVQQKLDAANLIFFPGARFTVNYLKGCDETLDRRHAEFLSLDEMLSPRLTASRRAA